MKAIVLCAGSGRRLYPLTKDMPKSLLPIYGKTILEYIIENLNQAGIEHIFLVTGFKKELIEDMIEKRGFNHIHTVLNEEFASTNTAFSLNLALREMDSDFILINGDVFFDKDILKELIAYPQKDCVVVDNTKHLAEEEVKVIEENTQVLKISKELDPKICLGEAIGINKISREKIEELSLIYNDLEKNREFLHFFEIGIERICENHGNFGILLTNKPWVEIDTFEDYDQAKNEIYPKLYDKLLQQKD